MALLNSEIQRIRHELGYNVLSVGAEPYIGYVAVFNQIVQAYTNAGAKTTSATYVPDPAGVKTMVTLSLALATGFTPGDSIWVDVDDRQESATLENISGSAISLVLKKPHGILAGTSSYQITVEGGEAIIRDILGKIRAINAQLLVTDDSVDELTSGGGLKRVDNIEFYSAGFIGATNVNSTGGARFASLTDQRKIWRRELASAVGVENLWDVKRSGGGSISLY